MHIDHHISAAKYLTFLLENRFRLFGFRFGLDPILGLAPWIGDIISAILAFYIVWIGGKVGVPQKQINRMVTNILIDLFIGIIPVIGSVGDFVFRSNTKNLQIILQYHGTVIDGEFTKTAFVKTV